MPDRPAVLITGATGYVGNLLVRRYLDTTDLDVITHGRRLLDVNNDADQGRIVTVTGDLTEAHAFSELTDRDRHRVVTVVHGAAVTRFNVDAETADAVNIGGAQRVLDMAADLPALGHFAFLSTVYTAGLRTGVVTEALFDGTAGFANEYERSKCEAEHLVAASGLPWSIIRLATAVADDVGGHVTQYNAFHTTLRLCFYGLLSLLPGSPSAPLYLVTGNFVAESIVELTASRAAGIFNACHTPEESIELQTAIDIAFALFASDESFRRKGILPPLLADAESFDLMTQGIGTFGSDLVSQAMATIAPFGRQLYAEKAIDNARLRASLSQYEAPDGCDLVERVTANLLETRWGRRAVAA